MRKIADGAGCEILVTESNEILKLFTREESSQEWIAKEVATHRLIERTELPVPRIKKTVEIESRLGILYEEIGEGKSLKQLVWSRPFAFFYHARLFGELLAKIHCQKIEELPSQRKLMLQRIEEATELPEEFRKAALAQLSKLPDGNQLCHGDFHLGNIIVEPKRISIIDWSEAVSGNPVADLTYSFIKLQLKGRYRGRIRPFFRSLFANTVLKRYPHFQAATLKEMNEWELPMAVFIGLSPWIPLDQKEDLFYYIERIVTE